MSVHIDDLVYQAVFGDDRATARYQIWKEATAAGIVPASIHELYMARGAGTVPSNFSVPAFNLRGMTYDMARAIFAASKKHDVGAMIFELARSEMSYTDQPPAEYITTIMAAALKESWSGPLFVQCDHTQAKAQEPGIPREGEIEAIKSLLRHAIGVGFYNVDIDMSTLVNLGKESLREQQAPNYELTAQLARFIRDIEPDDVTISLGGEIGHIGGVNSSVADFEVFMTGFLEEYDDALPALSKVSVQTGSRHGGIVNSDGVPEKMIIDFDVLSEISRVAREAYGMGGAVQHGASTLMDTSFHRFPEHETLEVHFATGLQNLVFEHPQFPADISEAMTSWIMETKQDERDEGMSDAQFIYATRKKAWGAFKQVVWDIESPVRAQIREDLQERFAFLFQALGVNDTKDMVQTITSAPVVSKEVADFETENDLTAPEGLDD